MNQYIYLLQEREFIRLNEPVYKLGKSKQENTKRIQSYPKGSSLIFMLQFENCDKAESDLLKIFRSKFTQKLEYGSEYFEGDVTKLTHEIYTYYVKNKSQTKLNILFTENMQTDFVNESSDASHQKIKSSLTKKYKCNLCHVESSHKNNFFKHCQSLKHRQQLCGDSFERKEEIKQKYNCAQCEKTFETKSGLWKHKTKCKEFSNNDKIGKEADLKREENMKTLLKEAIRMANDNQCKK